MITKIVLDGPATFSKRCELTIDKKVNLFYGLNGTGKSTICRLLRNPADTEFTKCSVNIAAKSKLFVYNQDFLEENFYQSETLPGVFSLSRANKEAEAEIAGIKRELEKAQQTRLEHVAEFAKLSDEADIVKSRAENALWQIKLEYAGGDRVLEYCLDGLKSKKENLLNFLSSIAKPAAQPSYTTESLKQEAAAISSDSSTEAQIIPEVAIDLEHIEKNPLLKEPIVGKDDSPISALIKKLDNSSWVHAGLSYIRRPQNNEAEQCPFCQDRTLTEHLVDQLDAFFDESYVRRTQELASVAKTYLGFIDSLPSADEARAHPFSTNDYLVRLQDLRSKLVSNSRLLDKKVADPGSSVVLDISSDELKSLNSEIRGVNKAAEEFNAKLKDKKHALAEIKKHFWDLMRWEYDQTLTRYANDVAELEKKRNSLESEKDQSSAAIKSLEENLVKARSRTVNIEDSINRINHTLAALGIDGFEIAKHSENLYRITRGKDVSTTQFQTLSEGEKTIITLLYFCEVCKGLSAADETPADRIVVFDDPISSLSHIYTFNVGTLIRDEFFKSNDIQQVLVFTHSLYFFYELTDPNHERRGKTQTLHRVYKSNGVSSIVPMKYDEIQNDYQAYWSIVNDGSQHPALIANCMRNIIEYFFGFVRKKDFNNVFQDPALGSNRFQAFSRYMNRESHSFGRNVFDLKEFNYEDFKTGLSLVFEKLGYQDHYLEMTKR